MLGSFFSGASPESRAIAAHRVAKSRWLAVSIAAALGLVACGSDDKDDDNSSTQSPVGTGDAGAGGATPARDGAVARTPADNPTTKPVGPMGAGNNSAVCESANTEPCFGPFVTTFGSKLELGKYGVAMEYNVGAAHKNMVSLLDNNTLCAGFASIFGQDAAQTSQLLDLRDVDLSLFTVYHPAKWVDGEKYPVVTWGNGTCAQPEGYGALLRYVASHGFVVVAANSRYSGTDNAQRHGIDFMVAANADPMSPYYQRLDLTKIAAMGHSQGGQATVVAATDERVKTAILFNGGMSASKPYLTISGDRDLATGGANTAEAKKMEISAAPKAAFLFYHMIPGTGATDGHLTLMVQPERVTGPTVAWLKFMLNDDAESKTWFVGADCKLCNKAADFEFGQNGL